MTSAATTLILTEPSSLLRGASINSTMSSVESITFRNRQQYNHHQRYNDRSPSPSKNNHRSRVTATPTVDNRRRSVFPTSTSKRSESPFNAPQEGMRVMPQDKTLKDRKTKIQVCVRVRPILPSDNSHYQTPQQHSPPKNSPPKKGLSPTASSGIKPSPMLDTEPAWVVNEHNVSQASHTNPEASRTVDYTFDHSFGPQHNTQEMYQSTVRDSVVSTMEGYHASVFAYGQTATGKTYTMTGYGGHKNTKVDDDDSKGIIQLAIQDCFNYIHNQKSETREYLLRVSFMEIYNEVINDLLAAPNRQTPYSMSTSYNSMAATPPAPSNIRIFESKNEGVIIRGLKEEIVTCPEQVYALLAAGEKRRQTGSTNLNKQSSRSHSIFRLIVESRKRIPRRSSSNFNMNNNSTANLSDTSSTAESIASSTFAPATTAGPVRVSTLSLVDLAGSESVKNTGSTGTRKKEGQYINKSLLTLGHVIYKLAEISSKGGDKRAVDATHIPYRDSKLTRLLQPSLSGNAQICIICNISPLARHIEESHLTLKFASRAKRIKQHATITEVVDEKSMLENYREEIEELKRQLKEAKDQQKKQQQEKSQQAPSTSITSTGADDQDAIVLSTAISNLERLILKTTTTEEKKRRKKRKERYMAAQQMKTEEAGTSSNGVVEFGTPLYENGDADSLLDMMDARTLDEDDDLLGGMSLNSRDKPTKDRTYGLDDQSVGSLSMGDDSTIMEGKKLVTELHRIRGLLGNVLERKGSVAQISDKNLRMRPGSSLSINEQEVERLRAQLHEQAVTTSLRKADSTFLQSQLQEKDMLLKDVSQILEAVENRQVELEADNDRLKHEYSRSLAALRSKESEVIILEKLMRKRELEIKRLKKKS